MIENILYEIDNAFNESESNVADAIIESCTKALEILENSSDDMDVNSFGVYQEAVEAALKKEPDVRENNITMHVNFKKAKEETKKNLSKQRDNALKTKIDTYTNKFAKLVENMNSKLYKSARSLVIGLPAVLKAISTAMKKYTFVNKKQNEPKPVQESSTGVLKSINRDILAKDNAVQAAVWSIKKAVDEGKSINEYDAAKLVDYFVKHYGLTKNDLSEFSRLLDDEADKIIKELPDVSLRLEKKYKKQFKEGVNKIKYIENLKNVADNYDKLNKMLIYHTVISSETDKPKYAQLRDSGNNVVTSSLYNVGAMFVGVVEDLINIFKDFGKIFKTGVEIAINDDMDVREKIESIILETYDTLFNDILKKHALGIGSAILTAATTLLFNSITIGSAILSVIKGTAEFGVGLLKTPLEIKATSSLVRTATEQMIKMMFSNWMMN